MSLLFKFNLLSGKVSTSMAIYIGICLLLLATSIESVCLNCEKPLNEWCCVTSWNGRCCEYPLHYQREKPKSNNWFSRWFGFRQGKPRQLGNAQYFGKNKKYDELLRYFRAMEVIKETNKKHRRKKMASNFYKKKIFTMPSDYLLRG